MIEVISDFLFSVNLYLSQVDPLYFMRYLPYQGFLY